MDTAVELKLHELETSAVPAAAVDYIRRALTSATEFDCYKLNAFRIAKELGLPRRDIVRTFLFATRLGIFDLNWDVYCPSCMGVPEYHRHLMQLGTRAHCGLCEINWDVKFEEQVEVTFTVNPDVRVLNYVDMKDRVYPAAVQAIGQSLSREARIPVFASRFTPGETRTVTVTLVAGEFDYLVPGYIEGGGTLTVSGEPDSGTQRVAFAVDEAGGVSPREIHLRPGVVEFTVGYRYPHDWGFHIRSLAPMNHWVSAAYITAQQDFRDLFSGEFLGPEASFAIRSTTIMFTDIRGSTEMYEALGDAAAYKLVQDHFVLMTEIVRANEGGIVKTIGDAVMACFPVNLDAVRAAFQIQTQFAAHPGALMNVEVKIGLHRGAAIAVTSNRALDFFGRTINIAARVQGRSKPREVLLTDNVLADPAVRAFIAEKGATPERFDALLKGVAGTIALSSVRPL